MAVTNMTLLVYAEISTGPWIFKISAMKSEVAYVVAHFLIILMAIS